MKRIALLFPMFVILLTPAARAEVLTLGDCLAMAASSNYALKVASHDEKIAAENVGIGKSAFFPRIDLQGGYTAQLEPQAIDAPVGSFATQDDKFAFFNLSIYQTLYDFGRTDSRYRRARAAREAATFTYAGQEKEVFLQVVQAYFGILQGRKILQAAEEEVAQMTDHLRVAQNFYEQGVVTRNDLLQAEVRLSASRQRTLEAANRVENGWLLLGYLIGQPPGYRAELEERATIEPVMPPAEPETAFAGRAEIKAQKKVVEGSEQEVRENRGGYYPELFARMNLDYIENSRVREQAIMAATVGLKINLFDGLATTARYRQSVQNRARNEELLRRLQEEIRIEHQTASNDARVAFELIKVAESAIRQGEENLRINKDRYQAQVGTATDVIDAQTLLTQTKTEYFRALYEYQVAVARVRKALGEL